MDDRTTHLEFQISRWLEGDEAAKHLLLDHAYARLRKLTARLLGAYPNVRRWEQTDDVLQNASIRLWNSLSDVEPENLRSFFGLAALQIRRELIDLARKNRRLLGPETVYIIADAHSSQAELSDPVDEQITLTEWTDLHEKVQLLPPEQLEVFDLVYYHELTQPEAADVLGVSLRTVKRRWREARKNLYDMFHGNPFSSE